MIKRVIGYRWAMAGILAAGAYLTLGGHRQIRPDLVTPLQDAVPEELRGFQGVDVTVSDEEARVAGFSEYLFRAYRRPSGAPGFSVYVGYYDHQTQGTTIHSPKNCLPGGGWEPVSSTRALVRAGDRDVEVNRYLIQRDQEQALVLYWYQGRGRVESSEYWVKYQLVRDAVVRGRTDEALVRIVVPITRAGQAEAFELARSVAEQLVVSVDEALPT